MTAAALTLLAVLVVLLSARLASRVLALAGDESPTECEDWPHLGGDMAAVGRVCRTVPRQAVPIGSGRIAEPEAARVEVTP